MSVHCLVPLFVSISILTSWFCLDSYKKFTILATAIPEFKTNFWISWSLSSADFDLWEVFLHIYGLTKVFLNFFEGNVSITTFSSFSFLKTPHRRYCKFFSSFLWMGIPSLPDAQILDVLEILKFLILVKCCNNSSSSSLLSPIFFKIFTCRVHSVLIWPEPDSVATKQGSIFGWFWPEFESKARSWAKFKLVKLLGVKIANYQTLLNSYF